MAKVKVLPEAVLPDFLEGARLDSERRFCISPIQASSKARMSWTGDSFVLERKSTYQKVHTKIFTGNVLFSERLAY